MADKNMETILRDIRETCGTEILSNGKRLIAVFCDFSTVKKDQRLLRYFVEVGGHTLLLDAVSLPPSMQQARFGQVVNKMCFETLVSQEAARSVCSAFWTVLHGTDCSSRPQTETKPETFEVDPDLEILGDTVVRYRGSKESVRIPAGIITIGKEAFFHNKTLTRIELPEGLQTIGKLAFDSTGLREVRFPDSLQTIDTWGFHNTQLESIVLPLGLQDASAWSFGSCRNLRKVEFRHMPQRLHPMMFSNCDSLEEVILPDGIEKVNLDDFRRCKEFMRIHIPDSVKDIHCFFAKDDQQFEITASQKWIAAHQDLFTAYRNCIPVPSGK